MASFLSHTCRLHVRCSSSGTTAAGRTGFTGKLFPREKLNQLSGYSTAILYKRTAVRIARNSASPPRGRIDVAGDGLESDAVSLGTMKLPSDIDFKRFDELLFQWANSLCQGANVPLPAPLKIDKVKGGVRLAFVKTENGVTQDFAYIDCLVFPAADDSGPIFRALRSGPLKEQPPPGEQRIMGSLLQALQMSVEIARVQA